MPILKSSSTLMNMIYPDKFPPVICLNYILSIREMK